jgi:hypothetical protein
MLTRSSASTQISFTFLIRTHLCKRTYDSSDESQASQLLKNVATRNLSTQPSAVGSAEYSLQDDYTTHISPRAPLSQYRIQGLVVSQTQDDKSTSASHIPVSSWAPPGLTSAASHSDPAKQQTAPSEVRLITVYPAKKTMLTSSILSRRLSARIQVATFRSTLSRVLMFHKGSNLPPIRRCLPQFRHRHLHLMTEDERCDLKNKGLFHQG